MIKNVVTVIFLVGMLCFSLPIASAVDVQVPSTVTNEGLLTMSGFDANARSLVNPVHKGSLVDGTGGALLSNPQGVFVIGNYAYVASTNSNALEIVDISKPSAPVHKGSIVNGNGGALLSQPSSVYVSGTFAYITSTSNNALEIVDVSNPANPRHVGSIIDGAGGAKLNYPNHVVVSGSRAYVTSANSNALEIIDISNPALPSHVASIVDGEGGALLNYPLNLYVSGTKAYVVSNSNALEIIDISNPASPTHLGNIVDGTGGAKLVFPLGIFVSGTTAYVASCGSQALEIVDVTNPASPVHKGSIVNGAGGAKLESAMSVFVSGKNAFVASANSKALEIVDVTNPSAPVHKGSIVDGAGGAKLAYPNCVFVSGTYAYVTSGSDNALEIVDSGMSPSPLKPVITKVTPYIGYPTANWPVTIIGKNFRDGATVQMNKGSVTKSAVVQSISNTRIKATLPTKGLKTGKYSLIVKNIDKTSTTKNNAFTVNAAGKKPTIKTIKPNSSLSSQNTKVTITGTNFRTGVTVDMVKGQKIRAGTIISSTNSKIVCMLPTKGATTGVWNIKVTNTDMTSILKSGGFIIKKSSSTSNEGVSGQISDIVRNTHNSVSSSVLPSQGKARIGDLMIPITIPVI